MNLLTEEQAKEIVEIAKHYGLKSQLDKLMEEGVELAAASHTLSRNPADDYYAVVDESADVVFLIVQILTVLLPSEAMELFKRRLAYKIDRQIKRIESEGENG